MNGITVIIPVFNEEQSLPKTINDVNKALEALDVEKEIIVVDDGSTDRTFELAKQSMGCLFRHYKNKGYGASLKTGIRNANYDIICITDADGTYPNDRIPALFEHMIKNNYDMVVGSRTGEKVKIPLLRRFPKWVLNKLANYLSGTKIPDINSGFRIMKKPEVERFFNILPDGFSFTSTITLAMLTNGYAVSYIPINYYSRQGKSKIRPIKDTLNFFQLIIRTVMYFNPLKIFVPLSLSLVLLAFLVLLGSWILTGKALDVTFGVILMTAVMVIVIGMLADLIDKRIGE